MKATQLLYAIGCIIGGAVLNSHLPPLPAMATYIVVFVGGLALCFSVFGCRYS